MTKLIKITLRTLATLLVASSVSITAVQAATIEIDLRGTVKSRCETDINTDMDTLEHLAEVAIWCNITSAITLTEALELDTSAQTTSSQTGSVQNTAIQKDSGSRRNRQVLYIRADNSKVDQYTGRYIAPIKINFAVN